MLRSLAGTLLLLLAALAALAAEPPDAKRYQPGIDRGLKWLADRQEPSGRWAEFGGRHTVQATSLAGLAFLAAGTTLTEGKYARNLRRAADWVEARVDADGRFIDPDDSAGTGYLMGHGHAMLFLSQVYATTADAKRKQALARTLEKAVAYAEKARLPKGGWGFVAPKDGGSLDEGYQSAAVLHGIFACRKAGIAVPKELVRASLGYLKDCARVQSKHKNPQKASAGIVYSLAQDRGDSGHPLITLAALSLLLNAGETEGDLAVQLLNSVQTQVTLDARVGNQTFTLFHFAQMGYQLGDDGHARLLLEPIRREQMVRWSECRKQVLDAAAAGQRATGAWKDVGQEVVPTAMRLIVLQMEMGTVPYYKRRTERR